MTTTTQNKIKQLSKIILANYTASGEPHPAFATQCKMEYYIKLVMGQPAYTEQLLEELIEDNLKARA